MLSASPRVALDANVLFPFTVRDTLLRSAAAGLFQVYWSKEILDETTRNLIAQGRMTPEQAEHLTTAMSRAFPEAIITDYEALIPSMLNDKKDRHVAAAAVKASAHLIVTRNLRDFRHLPVGLDVCSPDQFLTDLLERAPDTLLSLLQAQARALRRPPVTLNDLLLGLGKTVPRFSSRARAALGEM